MKPGSAPVETLDSDLREDALLRKARRFIGSHLVYVSLDDGLVDRLADALGGATGPMHERPVPETV